MKKFLFSDLFFLDFKMFGRRCCSSFSIRQMTQLAARFCAGKNVVHVVDPVVDLRHRFDDKDGLSQMLKARRDFLKFFHCSCAHDLNCGDFEGCGDFN